MADPVQFKICLLRSFHLYNSKILEKTFNNINHLTRLGLMPFWPVSKTHGILKFLSFKPKTIAATQPAFIKIKYEDMKE